MPIFIVLYLLITTHRIPRKIELFSIFPRYARNIFTRDKRTT